MFSLYLFNCMNDYNEHALLLNKKFKNKHGNKLTIHEQYKIATRAQASWQSAQVRGEITLPDM